MSSEGTSRLVNHMISDSVVILRCRFELNRTTKSSNEAAKTKQNKKHEMFRHSETRFESFPNFIVVVGFKVHTVFSFAERGLTSIVLLAC